jgi:hypothetical protein
MLINQTVQDLYMTEREKHPITHHVETIKMSSGHMTTWSTLNTP